MRIIKLTLSALAVAALLCLSGCNKENPWIPEVQGSHVSEMPYENIGDYTVEKFTNFKTFKKSSFADYNFIQRKAAKEERYSAEFFKTRDLAAIKFNRPENGIEYTVISANFSGNECVVELLPVKSLTVAETQDTTYCCFIETETDITNVDFKLEFADEVIHNSTNSGYITEENLKYLFENENAPVMFRIDARSGIGEFIDNDDILNRRNYISNLLFMKYSDEFFADSSLMLIRVPSSDLEHIAAYVNGKSVEIIGTKSNHYMYGWDKEQKFSALVALPVPKGFVPESTAHTNYTEWEDKSDNQAVHSDYTFSKATKITDNLTRFDFND